MIGGAVHGSGGAALTVHLMDLKGHNEWIRMGSSRGLLAETMEDQIDELTELARASGKKSAIRHAFASPAPDSPWGPAESARYWELYEKAMGLEGCPYSESIHFKPGAFGRPEHEHRVYLALTERGTLVRLGNDYSRQEAVSRIMEHETGAAFIKGKHNIRAMHFLNRFGRGDVAEAIEKAGLLDGQRAIAKQTPKQRAQAERTGVDLAEIERLTSTAWAASDNGPAFLTALAERGLVLAQGDKVAVILDGTGGIHPLARMLARMAKADGGEAVRAKDVRDRLMGIHLPSVDDARATIRNAEGNGQLFEAIPTIQPEPEPPVGNPVPSIIQESPAEAIQGESASKTITGGNSDLLQSSPDHSLGGGAGVHTSQDEAAPLHHSNDGGDPTAGLEKPAVGDIQGWIRYREQVARKQQQQSDQALAKAIAASQQRTKSTGGNHYGSSANTQDFGGHGARAWKIINSKAHGRRTQGIEAPAHTGAAFTGHYGSRGETYQANPRTRESGQSAEWRSPDHPPGYDGTDPGRELAVGRGEGVVVRHRGEVDEHGRQAFLHRVTHARASRCLGAIDVADLRRRLAEPEIAKPVHPYEAPETRDPIQAVRLAKEALRAEQCERETRARQAEDAAREARAALRFPDRAFAFIGITTTAQARVDELQDEARRLADAAEFRKPTLTDFNNAAERAESIARYRARVFSEWEKEQVSEASPQPSPSRIHDLGQAVPFHSVAATPIEADWVP